MTIEERREYQRKYYVEHREHEREKRKKYYYENKDKWRKPYDKEKRHEYYLAHKEQIYASNEKWRKAHLKDVSQMVLNCKRRRVAKLREQGVTNPWRVVNYHKEPKYNEKRDKDND